MSYEVLANTEIKFRLLDTEANLRLTMHKLKSKPRWVVAIKDLTSGWMTTGRPISSYPTEIKQLQLNNTMCVIESCAGIGDFTPFLTRLNGARPGRIIVIDFANYQNIRTLLEASKSYRNDLRPDLDELTRRCDTILGPEVELHNCSIEDALCDPSLRGVADVLVENCGPASKTYKKMSPDVYQPFMKPNGRMIIN